MTATNRLNLLLSDILKNEPSLSIKNSQESSSERSSLSLLTFAEHDYHPLIKEAPLPPRRNPSSIRNHRQRHRIHQSDIKNHQEQVQPLLNSSTLDDLFRAFTLECEQYLADSSISSYQNKTYGQFIIQSPSPTIQANVDSNDDDYENLHSSKVPLSNGISPLKTSIEVVSPEKRQVVSISVSTKKSSSPIVSSSRTYPLLSASCTSTSIIPSKICQSSEEDSIDISSSSTNRKRRRRTRKQQIIPSTTQASSSDDERTETNINNNNLINEKQSTVSKRSCSIDHRQQRTQSIYDNHPISLPSQKFVPRRRRDISLQQQHTTKYYDNNSVNFQENLCSPLSVLLTSTRPTSDFVDRSQQRRSRLELDNYQPLTLLDRMHQQFYRPSPTRHNNNNNNNNNNNIPTHRIPSYPVY